MKRIIRFSYLFIPAAVMSVALIAAGIAGYVLKGGFNLGVDFQAGLLQEVRFAPQALSFTWTGPGNADISANRDNITIGVSGTESQNKLFQFDFSAYQTLDELCAAMSGQLEGLTVNLSAPGGTKSAWLIESSRESPRLSASVPFTIHYLEPDSPPIEISAVRAALEPLGTASVQALGEAADRHFMIRLEEKEGAAKPEEAGAAAAVAADAPDAAAASVSSGAPVLDALEAAFGAGNIVITRSDYVGSRFSKQLQDQAGILMALTMLLILVYVSFRFKPQFAVGAVLAIAHDALIMVAFIAWSRMEFNTTTIAAILTILGYSINDTIVVFDRIRETRRLYHDMSFRAVLDRALSETLARTVITTFTTMLAVFSLYFFTTGSMKDFAQALLVGMVSGVYSTIFIASGWTLFWEKHLKRGEAAS